MPIYLFDGVDNEEQQFRLPEHEAARCLLSLSQTPPTPSQPLASPNVHYGPTLMVSGEHSPVLSISPNSLGEPASRAQRRPMPFGSPPPQQRMTTEPQLLKADDNVANSMPIDLTNKKTPKEGPRKRTVALLPPVTSAYAGPAAFLSSLMCNTDKVPSANAMPHNGDYTTMVGHEPISLKVNNNDVLMQNYITERAMQDTKIKQSQMNRDCFAFAHKNYRNEIVERGVVEPVPIKLALPEHVMISVKVDAPIVTKQQQQPKEIVAAPPKHEESKVIQTEMSAEDVNLAIQKHFEQSNVSFGIDTLAEIAASSSKLETNRAASAAKSPLGVRAASPVPENNAKSVASEYLKMTSAEYLKAHNSTNAITNGVATGNSSNSNCYTANDRENTSEKASTVAKPVDSVSDVETNDDLLKQQPHTGTSASERGPAAPATALISARTVVVGETGFKTKSSSSSELPVLPFAAAAAVNNVATARPPLIQDDGGRCVCSICEKTFLKKSQLTLHMNIHFVNVKKFFCEPCGLNLKTQGRMDKHERSESHKREIMKSSSVSQVAKANPRPFECSDCNIGFRIHGHLAKHLRSKTHVQKLENLQKLPFGTYAEIERAGISLTDINTTTCESSLDSLKTLAQKLLVDTKEPSDREHATGDRRHTESNSDDGGDVSTSASMSNGQSHNDDDVIPSKRRRSNNASECSFEPDLVGIKSP